MKVTLLLLAILCGVFAERYIVVFHNHVTDEIRASHVNRIRTVFANYTIGQSFKAYAADLTPLQVQDEMNTGNINYIEKDAEVHISQSCKTQSSAVWGLNRISERSILLNGQYKYDSDGAGVQAFIIDTGVLTTHTEFAGRAVWGANYAGDGKNTDCNGHGTHVAGTVGGTLYGVAKQVSIIAVKVLGCTGSGTNAGVISGIQYAANNRKGKPSVANMSLGGGFSQALNDAVKAAVKAGVVFAVAAGNENQDACNVSPASETSAITVGSTDVEDKGTSSQIDVRSSFSNFGKCVKVLAPGSLIKSAWYTSNTATNTISGTSMASPHVAGVAALILGDSPLATPDQVEATLLGQSTSNEIDLACSTTACRNTPNKLLYSACG